MIIRCRATALLVASDQNLSPQEWKEPVKLYLPRLCCPTRPIGTDTPVHLQEEEVKLIRLNMTCIHLFASIMLHSVHWIIIWFYIIIFNFIQYTFLCVHYPMHQQSLRVPSFSVESSSRINSAADLCPVWDGLALFIPTSFSPAPDSHILVSGNNTETICTKMRWNTMGYLLLYLWNLMNK